MELFTALPLVPSSCDWKEVAREESSLITWRQVEADWATYFIYDALVDRTLGCEIRQKALANYWVTWEQHQQLWSPRITFCVKLLWHNSRRHTKATLCYGYLKFEVTHIHWHVKNSNFAQSSSQQTLLLIKARLLIKRPASTTINKRLTYIWLEHFSPSANKWFVCFYLLLWKLKKGQLIKNRRWRGKLLYSQTESMHDSITSLTHTHNQRMRKNFQFSFNWILIFGVQGLLIVSVTHEIWMSLLIDISSSLIAVHNDQTMVDGDGNEISDSFEFAFPWAVGISFSIDFLPLSIVDSDSLVDAAWSDSFFDVPSSRIFSILSIFSRAVAICRFLRYSL